MLLKNGTKNNPGNIRSEYMLQPYKKLKTCILYSDIFVLLNSTRNPMGDYMEMDPVEDLLVE